MDHARISALKACSPVVVLISAQDKPRTLKDDVIALKRNTVSQRRNSLLHHRIRNKHGTGKNVRQEDKQYSKYSTLRETTIGNLCTIEIPQSNDQ